MLALALVGLLLVTPLPGTTAEAAPHLAALQAWLDGTRDLQARFSQALVSGALGGSEEEEGRLLLKRPGRMRWEYDGGGGKLALVDGQTSLLYLPEGRQLIRGSLGEGAGLLPALLAGPERLADLFTARIPDGPSEPGALRLALRPRAEGEVEEIVLILKGGDHAVLGAEVTDPAGNRMVYRFRALRRNVGVPDGAFRFIPPPGTEVVEAGGSPG